MVGCVTLAAISEVETAPCMRLSNSYCQFIACWNLLPPPAAARSISRVELIGPGYCTAASSEQSPAGLLAAYALLCAQALPADPAQTHHTFSGASL